MMILSWLRVNLGRYHHLSERDFCNSEAQKGEGSSNILFPRYGKIRTEIVTT